MCECDERPGDADWYRSSVAMKATYLCVRGIGDHSWHHEKCCYHLGMCCGHLRDARLVADWGLTIGEDDRGPIVKDDRRRPDLLSGPEVERELRKNA